MKKRILITGANGLLGQKLVGLLTKQSNVELIATARGDNRLPVKEGYTYRSMDITDRQQVLDVTSDVQPNVVIHGAAMTDVDKCETQKDACWAQNVHAVEYIIEACRVGRRELSCCTYRPTSFSMVQPDLMTKPPKPIRSVFMGGASRLANRRLFTPIFIGPLPGQCSYTALRMT